MSVAAALRQHAGSFLSSLKQVGKGLHPHVHQVLSVLTRCRSGDLGGVMYDCDGCGRRHWVGRSCGNRHCSTCQQHKTAEWLEKQTSRLLPVAHFLVTFTLPKEVRWLLRAFPKDGYEALLAAVNKAVKNRTRYSKYLTDCELGYMAVLHTWGRDFMTFHPHVHCLIPAGAPAKDGSRWHATTDNFLFPHQALINDYRRFFQQECEERGLADKA